MNVGDFMRQGLPRSGEYEMDIPKEVFEITDTLCRVCRERGTEWDTIDGDSLDRRSREQDEVYGRLFDELPFPIHQPGTRRHRVSPQPGGYNLIPSDFYGQCHDRLIAICFEEDRFDRRLMEALDHASLHCRQTKEIFFITRNWRSDLYDRERGHIQELRDRGVSMVFIYVTERGYTILPE